MRWTSIRHYHISNCNKPKRPQNYFLGAGCVHCLSGLLSWTVFWFMVNIVTDVPDLELFQLSDRWQPSSTVFFQTFLYHCGTCCLLYLHSNEPSVKHFLYFFFFSSSLHQNAASLTACVVKVPKELEHSLGHRASLQAGKSWSISRDVHPKGWLDVCLGVSSRKYLESKVILVIN